MKAEPKMTIIIRSCPGSHFANHYLYLVVVRLLATIQILPPTMNGVPQMPPLEFVTALVPYVALQSSHVRQHTEI